MYWPLLKQLFIPLMSFGNLFLAFLLCFKPHSWSLFIKSLLVLIFGIVFGVLPGITLHHYFSEKLAEILVLGCATLLAIEYRESFERYLKSDILQRIGHQKLVFFLGVIQGFALGYEIAHHSVEGQASLYAESPACLPLALLLFAMVATCFFALKIFFRHRLNLHRVQRNLALVFIIFCVVLGISMPF